MFGVSYDLDETIADQNLFENQEYGSS
jgi:hypothetical protein